MVLRQSRRTFVERVDVVSTVGYGSGAGVRERLGLRGRGPTMVVTDLGVLRPDPTTCEPALIDVHPGVQVEHVRAAAGWTLTVSPDLRTGAAPTEEELAVLRRLEATLEPGAHGDGPGPAPAGAAERRRR